MTSWSFQIKDFVIFQISADIWKMTKMLIQQDQTLVSCLYYISRTAIIFAIDAEKYNFVIRIRSCPCIASLFFPVQYPRISADIRKYFSFTFPWVSWKHKKSTRVGSDPNYKIVFCWVNSKYYYGSRNLI